MSPLLALNWEPQIRGILIIIISVTVLMGSVYLILGTNLGARLGFLLSLSALSGWMMLMAVVWWSFGIGLKGDDVSWKAVPGKTILLDASAVQQAGVFKSDAVLPAADASPAVTDSAIDTLLKNNGWTQVGETAKNYGPSASAAGVVVEADGTLKAGTYQVVNVFDKGGERYPKINETLDFIAFLHKPHWILVEVAPLITQRAEPGRAPASPEVDTSQPHRYVYMIRDLGNKRVPAAEIAIGSAIVFFSCCYLLHIRDRRVLANRTGLAVPAAGS
ncbi:MAG: hypothetical protein JWM34_2025 [Ilumatobacteraceae bacterium]|nr:hypothetical protein [Ilumatobacteraceae bacterium]